MRRVTPAVLVGIASGLLACGHPTDAELIRSFSDHREALESIVRMANEDKHLVRVASDFTWLANDVSWPRRNIGLTPERWQRYRDPFREAGVSEGYLRVGEHQIQLLTSTKGLVTGVVPKGMFTRKRK